jgi:hypothetical protein
MPDGFGTVKRDKEFFTRSAACRLCLRHAWIIQSHGAARLLARPLNLFFVF